MEFGLTDKINYFIYETGSCKYVMSIDDETGNVFFTSSPSRALVFDTEKEALDAVINNPELETLFQVFETIKIV